MFSKIRTLKPETNSKSSENQWLEDEDLLGAKGLCSGVMLVSGSVILLMEEILHQLIDSLSPRNPKQPYINGCFNWMIPNLYMENGCFTKHLFINGCLGFQAII